MFKIFNRKNKKIKYEEAIYHFPAIFHMYEELYPIENDINKEFYYELFDNIFEYCEKELKEIISIHIFPSKHYEIIQHMGFDTLNKFFLFLDWFEDRYSNKQWYIDTLMIFVINNKLTTLYPATIFKHIKLEKYFSNRIKVSDYLDDDVNLKMAIKYSLNPLFNTDDYIINYHSKYPMVYSLSTNMTLVFDKIFPYSEDNANLDFIDGYYNFNGKFDYIIRCFESEEECNEFVYEAKIFNLNIQEALN